jgi:sensor c-di-GMP phosphodiesterase-like protein
MSTLLASLADLLLKSAVVAFVLNEVRGIVLAGPVLYAMYQAGGTLMAIWLGVCSLAGIALSVVVPLFVERRFKLRERLRSAIQTA